MRKQIILLLAVLLPMFAFDMNADEADLKKIPLQKSLGKRLDRSLIVLSVESCYNGMISSVITTISENLGEVSLTVTNLSTGETWYDTFDSSSTPQVVTTISGSTGIYEIVYITESGDVYEGNFML